LGVHGQAWREAGGQIGVIGGWALPFKVVPSLLHFGKSSSGMGRRGAAGPEMRRGRTLPPSRLLSFDCLPIRAAIGQTASRSRTALGPFLPFLAQPRGGSRSMTARLPIGSAHDRRYKHGFFPYLEDKSKTGDYSALSPCQIALLRVSSHR